MTEKLKKCPFCGGEAKIVRVMNDYPNYVIQCNECRLTTKWYADKKELIKYWNTRAADENPALTIEELKQMNREPVWINSYSILHYLGEGVIEHDKDCFVAYYFGMDKGEFLDVADYGKTWLAYRRKPEDNNEKILQ